MALKTWTPYYRTGGTENFQWVRALAVTSHDEAQRIVAEMRRAGHAAYYEETSILDAVGLPETFSFSDRVADVLTDYDR